MPRWWRGLCANGTGQLSERSQVPTRGTSCPRLDAPVQREHLLADRGEGGAAGSAPSLSSLHQGFSEALIQGIEQVPRALVAHLHLASCRGDGPGLLDALQQISLTWPDLDVWPNHDAQMQGEFSRSRLQFRAPLTGPVVKAPVYRSAHQGAVVLLIILDDWTGHARRFSDNTKLDALVMFLDCSLGQESATIADWRECAMESD
jgi:hypothetical protein